METNTLFIEDSCKAGGLVCIILSEETLGAPICPLNDMRVQGSKRKGQFLNISANSLCKKDQITYPLAWLPTTGPGTDGFTASRLLFKSI